VFLPCPLHVLLPRYPRFLGAGLHLSHLSHFRGPAQKRAGLARYSWLTKATTWDGSLNYNDWNIKQGEALPFSFDNDSDEVRGDYGGFRLREL
jgi:hypothetical protein